MRKEILFAIAAGVIFGIVVALGIWRANSALQGEDVISTESTQDTNGTSDTANVIFGLAVSEPEENDVLTSSPIAITGVTTSETWVAISAEGEDYTLRSNQSGEFSQEVELVAGINQLHVSAHSHDGQSIEENFTVVFSTEFEKEE